MIKEQTSNLTTTILVIFWMIYLVVYLLVKMNGPVGISGVLALLGQTSLDVIAFHYCLKIRKNSSDKKTRNIMFWFGLSFLCAASADLIYNLIVNVLVIPKISLRLELAYAVPFLLFLAFQAMGWKLILPPITKDTIGTRGIHLLILNILAAAIVIYYPLFFFVSAQPTSFILHAFDNLFELIAFILAVFCLMARRLSFLFYLGIGYLTVISSDFVLRFYEQSSHFVPASVFEMFWVLGLLLICLGLRRWSLFAVQETNNSSDWFYPWNAIQPQIGMLSFTFCSLIFLGYVFLCSLFLVDHGQSGLYIIKDLSPLYVMLAFFSVALSSLLSRKVVGLFGQFEDTIKNIEKIDVSSVSMSGIGGGGTSIHEIEKLQGTILASFQDINEKRKIEIALNCVARQLAHDIRSPLAALDVAVSQLGALPEENRILIRRAVQRIHDIANDLLHKRKSSVAGSSDSAELVSTASFEDNKSVQLLSGVVEALISEKRMQFRSRIGIEIEGQIDQDAHGIFATIQITEFKRVLSNLINNAVEALGESGRVFIKLHRQEKNAIIEISDNGKGIPPEILPKLMQQGETHGKKGGSGLGLYHAKMSVEGWGGSVNLFSEVDKGTSVRVNLPLQEPPDWFVPELKINSGSIVVVIDDDDSIHEIWRQRFEPLVKKGEITLRHFSSPDEFETWCGRGDGGDLYLCDYEFLNHKKNGVDLIRELGISQKSILVTSRFEEENVRKGCRDLGVCLIPKTLAGFVPITHDLPYDAILLDDDDLVHMNWKMKAKISRKQIKTFTHPDSLYGELKNFSKDTPIYVDSSLSDNIRGEDVAKKLCEAGFANLFLATGYDKSNFADMPWLKDIVGKNPPW